MENADATSKNLKAENRVQEEATALRKKFEKLLSEALDSVPAGPRPSGAPSAVDLLRQVGITKLSLKCEKTKDLARRVTDDTWIQLMLVGCTQRAIDFIEEQGWEDCEEIVESAATRYLPHREEAYHIFAKACPGAEMGTRQFSCLVALYKLACLKVHGSPSPPGPPGPAPAQQVPPHTFQFASGSTIAIGNQNKFRGDSHEVEEQISMDPDHKDIFLIKAIYKIDRPKSLRSLAGIVKDHHLPSKNALGTLRENEKRRGLLRGP